MKNKENVSETTTEIVSKDKSKEDNVIVELNKNKLNENASNNLNNSTNKNDKVNETNKNNSLKKIIK